jgi:hypothetical protein
MKSIIEAGGKGQASFSSPGWFLGSQLCLNIAPVMVK